MGAFACAFNAPRVLLQLEYEFETAANNVPLAIENASAIRQLTKAITMQYSVMLCPRRFR